MSLNDLTAFERSMFDGHHIVTVIFKRYAAGVAILQRRLCVLFRIKFSNIA
jgi:hypothetical protein